MRLLTLNIQEPRPGQVLHEMAAVCGEDEAARRYRAIAVTTLRQLRGLANARLRILVDPADADEAVRFWLLPRLAERWQTDDGMFRSDGWEIDFGGGSDGFSILATGDILCPYLGARWVHAGLLGLGRTAGEIIGPATDGTEYFRAGINGEAPDLPARILPDLPVIRTDVDWHAALDSALSGSLKRAWEEESP